MRGLALPGRKGSTGMSKPKKHSPKPGQEKTAAGAGKGGGKRKGMCLEDRPLLVYRFIKSYPFFQGPGKPSSGGPQAFH
jgi:hypothetical protein